MKTIITIEDDEFNDEVVVNYKTQDESGKEVDSVEDTTPAVDMTMAVINFIELLIENPEGVSYEDVIRH